MKYAIRTILAVAAIGGGVYAMSSTDGTTDTTDHQCTQRVAELENQVAVYEQTKIIEEQYDKLEVMERVRGDAETSR